jgi:hypothetical protein
MNMDQIERVGLARIQKIKLILIAVMLFLAWLGDSDFFDLFR